MMKTLLWSLVAALQIALGSSSYYGGYSSYSSSSSASYTYYGDAYGNNFFADTDVSYYDGYQQSWRYLGWYVKCGSPSGRYDEEDSHENSHDSGDDNTRYSGNNWCQRYLIWASYVDESYQGGGNGEYSYFDPYTQEWDESACEINGNGRCAKMDCHMTNTTTWKLMGVYKEASYFGDDAFFEQLFKHEGICVWNDESLYEFMSESRESAWPEGCVSTGISLPSNFYSNGGTYLYLDLKPTWNGNMTYGLYTDQICKTDYEGKQYSVEKVAKNMGLLYGKYLQQWNDAMEVYKVCQPCRSYNLLNTKQYYPTYSYSDGGENDYSSYSDPNSGYFECLDGANYINVNQCMKFRTHADLEVATWEDLVAATNQGGILQVNISGTVYGSERMSAKEYKYWKTTRQAQVDKRVLQLQALEAQQKKAKADAQGSIILGSLLLTLGSVFLVGAFTHTMKKRRERRSGQKQLAAPLLDTAGGTMA